MLVAEDAHWSQSVGDLLSAALDASGLHWGRLDNYAVLTSEPQK